MSVAWCSQSLLTIWNCVLLCLHQARLTVRLSRVLDLYIHSLISFVHVLPYLCTRTKLIDFDEYRHVSRLESMKQSNFCEIAQVLSDEFKPHLADTYYGKCQLYHNNSGAKGHMRQKVDLKAWKRQQSQPFWVKLLFWFTMCVRMKSLEGSYAP